MALQVQKHLFTVDEFYRMAEAGIFSEDDRVELIEGEIIEMPAIGARHAACVKRLNALFTRYAGAEVIISVQDPLRLSDYSETQPDIALLRPRDDFYAAGHPGPADTLLVVEVAETSLAYDRTTKLASYAKVGIPELWLVDLLNETMEVYTQPTGRKYRARKRVGRGGSLTPQGLPNLTLAIDDVLG